MATYGDFPGVRVETESGGISSVAIGAEEKVIIFGEASYDGQNDVEGDDTSLSISANSPEQIQAPRVADNKFGSDSELANAMKDALENGANINFLYGVAVDRVDVTAETHSTETGTLDNVEIVEDVSTITVDDTSGATDVDVEFRYSSPPPSPTDDSSDVDAVFINPLTGEYAADQAPSGDLEFDYTYNDYASAFGNAEVRGTIEEDETGVWFALSESDSVSSSMDTEVSDLRNDYQLVSALSFAEPNDSEELEAGETTDENGGADALYDTANYDTANQSITEAYYYKFAPSRQEDETETIGGGIAGVFAGNPIDDPIYNEPISGYQSLEQKFTKTDEDNMRAENVIPIRSGGTMRIKGNRSTAYDEPDTPGDEFWTRRVTDRVILIGKLIGDRILGRINDADTRNEAERAIRRQMRELSRQRLIRGNTPDETNWNVNVYEDENNANEVNIDITFTPFGIVKNVDETITVDTS